ncbi:MAG TPA: hypothetical protein VLX68_06085 [Chitinivibrionales bacterium]|nr:hypothetical protein [Chitinivibrionales bacterium]
MPLTRFLAILLFLTFVSLSFSKTAGWTKTKFPAQTGVTAMAVCNTAILVGTNGSMLYRSVDNGATWSVVRNGDDIFSFFVRGMQVYAGSRGKILQSADCGKNWKAIRTPRDMDTISSLLVFNNYLFAVDYHQNRPERVLRAINPLPLADFGQWNIFSDGVLPSLAHGLHLSTNGQRVFLGTETHGVFVTMGGLERKLISGGPTPVYNHIPSPWMWAWNKAGFGLPNPNGLVVSGLAVFGQGIFAVTGAGVFHSEGLGITWTRVSGSLPQDARVTAFCAEGSNTMFCATHECIYCGKDRYNNAASTQKFVDWTALPNDGLPAGALSTGVSYLAVCNGYLFAMIPNKGIYRW